MPNRVIREGLIDSDKLSEVGWAEQVLFIRLMLLADDFGRFDGRPEIIYSRCYPMDMERVRLSDVKKWVKRLLEMKLVLNYKVENKLYLLIPNFKQRLRIQKSKYPCPLEDIEELMSVNCQTYDCQLTDRCQTDDRPESESETETEYETEKNTLSSKLPAKTEKKDKLNASLSNQDLTGVVEYFNLKCDRLPKVVKMTEARKTKLKNRINEFGLDGINTLFNKVSESNFLNGESGWKASFDWIIDSETKVAKILEGHYDNKEKPSRFDDCKRLYERLDREEREGEQEGNVKAIELDKSFLS